MKVNFSALFSRTPTYPYLGQKSLYLSPLYFARQGLGNSGIFLIYYIAYMVTEPRVNSGTKEDWDPWFMRRVSSC